CHRAIDPLHFAFESFDGVGALRTVDNGRPVDATGALTGTDADGPFENGIELQALLARGTGVSACLARRRVAAVVGRDDVEADGAHLARMAAALDAAGGDTRALWIGLVGSD